MKTPVGFFTGWVDGEEGTRLTTEFYMEKWIDDDNVLIDDLNNMQTAEEVTEYLTRFGFHKTGRRLLDDEEL